MTTDSLESLLEEILRFRDERDWGQFHSPKNLAAALAIEAAELQETMLWKSDSEVETLLAGPARERVSQEIADVLIYAILLAHEARITLADAVRDKLVRNGDKYPVNKSRGNAAKYTELPE